MQRVVVLLVRKCFYNCLAFISLDDLYGFECLIEVIDCMLIEICII